MATKIGYVRQEPSQQINWAEVGANFTGMLNEEARVREAKKAEIDRATREQMNVLKNTPMGDSTNMNQWALKYADDAQKQLLMANSLLKSGKLKPNEYTLLRQNLADGTDQAFSLVQEYQNEYATKMERLKSDNPDMSSQELEVYLMETAEGFGNFNKSQLVINPTTGEVLVGFKNPETGELESDPNKLVGVNNLRNRITAKFDKYNMNAAVLQGKEMFGKFETISRKVGSRKEEGMIIKYSDPTLRNEAHIKKLLDRKVISEEEAATMRTFDKSLDSWLDSQLSMYNVSSLLTDNLRNIGGKPFKYTANPEEQDENTILYKQVDGRIVLDFESEIGKKQRETAKEGLKTVFLGALDHEETTTTVNDYTAPTYMPQYLYDRSTNLQTAKEDISMLGKLYYGTPAEIESARSYFENLSPNILAVQRDESGITVKAQDANGNITQRKVYFNAGGQRLSAEEFIKGAGPLLSGQTDISTALSAGGYERGRAFNPTKDVFHTAGNVIELPTPESEGTLIRPAPTRTDEQIANSFIPPTLITDPNAEIGL